MPRKRVTKPTPIDQRSNEDDDDFFLDDNQSNSGRNGHEPLQRNAANARERARMRVLSKAFCRLKTTLPWVPADTKLSKLDTLRLATSYIAHLRALLHEPRSQHTPPHPLNLAWPFAFQHGGSLSCTISQRWNLNSVSDSNQTRNHSRDPNQNQDLNENYSNEYENEYEDRYDDVTNEPYSQYCNYSYKENSYDMRNGYSTDNITNNV